MKYTEKRYLKRRYDTIPIISIAEFLSVAAVYILSSSCPFFLIDMDPCGLKQIGLNLLID